MLGHSPAAQPTGLWSFDEYRQFLLGAWPGYQTRMEPAARVRLTTEYMHHLPVYAIARCPFCDRQVTQHVDTHSLNGLGWERRGAGYGWAQELGGQIPLEQLCGHVRIIAEYLNLKGERPDDLFPDKVIRSGPETPSIMLVPMRAPGARAVIHQLPIGRFDEIVPRPHYSVYFLTYFTESAAAYDAATANWGVHYGRVEDQDVSYELVDRVRDGGLLWLDQDDPQLPLASPLVEAFPYGVIAGDRWPEHIITRAGIARPRRSLADRVLGLFDRR